MVGVGRPRLRELFDESPTPLIGHPPMTHQLDYYLATDGSYRTDGGGLGTIIETSEGRPIDRTARADVSPDNNVAEFRALHLGLDIAESMLPAGASLGVIVDHADLAANVNAVGIDGTAGSLGTSDAVSVPTGAERHWRGILARLASRRDIRAACVDGRRNPAHWLANDPESYAHLGARPVDRGLAAGTSLRGRETVPPPSRRQRQNSD